MTGTTGPAKTSATKQAGTSKGVSPSPLPSATTNHPPLIGTDTGTKPGTGIATNPDTELVALRRDILTRPGVLAKIRRRYRYRQNQRLELNRKVRKMEQDMTRRVEEEFLKTKDPRLSNADKRRLETGRRLEEMPGYQKLVNQREELQTAIYTLEDDLAAGREALRAEIAVLTSLNPAPVIVSMATGIAPGVLPGPTSEMITGVSPGSSQEATPTTPGGIPCEP